MMGPQVQGDVSQRPLPQDTNYPINTVVVQLKIFQSQRMEVGDPETCVTFSLDVSM